MKKLFCIALAALVFAASLCGCTSLYEGKATSKKLTEYFTKSPVKAARFYQYNYVDGENVLAAEELPAELLSGLTQKLDEMELLRHSFHADYFWGGRYGIELEFEDGTFMTYDGTKAEHHSASVAEGNAEKLSSGFLEVANMDFWEAMAEFFKTVEPGSLYSY